MIQLSLSLAVIGRENTESLQKVYTGLIGDGLKHSQIEDKLLELVQDRFEKEIEEFCNRYMIYSNLKVAEDIITELKQLNR